MRKIHFRLNRLGNVPITILVMGIFAVCTLANSSFVISNISVRNDFIGVSMIGKLNYFEEEIMFYAKPEINKNPAELMPLFGNGVIHGNVAFHGGKNGNQYFLNATYSERKFEFSWPMFKTERIIYIEYTFPQK